MSSTAVQGYTVPMEQLPAGAPLPGQPAPRWGSQGSLSAPWQHSMQQECYDLAVPVSPPVSPLRRWFSFPQRCSHVHGPTTGLPRSPRQHGPSGCSVLPEPRPRPCPGPRHRPRRHGTDGKLQRPLWREHSTFLRRLAGRLLRESPAIGAPELTTHAHTHTRPDQIVFVGDFLYYVLLVLFPHDVEGLTLTVNKPWRLTLQPPGFEVTRRFSRAHTVIGDRGLQLLSRYFSLNNLRHVFTSEWNMRAEEVKALSFAPILI